MITTFHIKNGFRDFDAIVRQLDYMTQLPDGTYDIVVRKAVSRRSLKQNALMWKWFSILSQEVEGCYNEQVWHDYFCNLFNSHYVTVGKSRRKVTKGTHNLSVKGMQIFLDKIQKYIQELFPNIILPSADDMEELDDRFYDNR